jgi:protein-S-isoprenylcysteine O-methyltransferase Ste14
MSNPGSPNKTARILAATYGLVAYVVFLGAFLYAIAWVGGLPVPHTVDRGPAATPTAAVLVDALLLAAFAIQHSGMARQGFKRVWTRLVPPVIERSTYVLVSSSLLIGMFVWWRPMTWTVWSVESPVGALLLRLSFVAGWLLVLLSTFVINHFDLFGLRQVWIHLKGLTVSEVPFQVRFVYRVVRHPLMLGFLVAFWSTPHMTAGHLLFAGMTTAYILVAIQLEERDLAREHGRDYEEYRRRVPMLVPVPTSGSISGGARS